MPTAGEKTTRTKPDGTTEDVFTVEFTNGAIKQLEELKDFLKVADLMQVVQIGIAYLQKLKEHQQPKKPEDR